MASSPEASQFIGLMDAITDSNGTVPPARAGIMAPVDAPGASSAGLEPSPRIQQNPAAHQQLADVIGFEKDVIGTE